MEISEQKIENKHKTPEFYKEFYEQNRVVILQYESLRKNFNKMVNNILGKDYYNIGMDVYHCDEICCEDITKKLIKKTLWQRLLNS